MKLLIEEYQKRLVDIDTNVDLIYAKIKPMQTHSCFQDLNEKLKVHIELFNKTILSKNSNFSKIGKPFKREKYINGLKEQMAEVLNTILRNITDTQMCPTHPLPRPMSPIPPLNSKDALEKLRGTKRVLSLHPTLKNVLQNLWPPRTLYHRHPSQVLVLWHLWQLQLPHKLLLCLSHLRSLWSFSLRIRETPLHPNPNTTLNPTLSSSQLNVIHLPAHDLTSDEIAVLSKGLTFCPNNRLDKFVAIKDLHLYTCKITTQKHVWEGESRQWRLSHI